MQKHDIAFLGHMCYDKITPFGGEPSVTPGSAVLCGACAAARVGAQVQVIVRMSPDDDAILQPMRDLGIDCTLVPAAETTMMEVIHPTADVDVREMRMLHNAGPLQPEEIPEFDAHFVHLAGISNQEFTMPLIENLKQRGLSLSVDMQSFVRQADPETGVVTFADVENKREIVACMDRVKLDIVEARLLTGKDDLAAAAEEIAGWGCPEVVITEARGVLARFHGDTLYETFTNRGVAGRTGRGDTTFAGYMTRRLTHSPDEALAFAAALVSIKMETPGPFAGTIDDVLARMDEPTPTA